MVLENYCTRSVLTIYCRKSINDPARPDPATREHAQYGIDLVTFYWRNFSKSVDFREIDKIRKEFIANTEKKTVLKNENPNPPNRKINHPRSFNFHCRKSKKDPTRPGHPWNLLKTIDLVPLCWDIFRRWPILRKLIKPPKKYVAETKQISGWPKTRKRDLPNRMFDHPRPCNLSFEWMRTGRLENNCICRVGGVTKNAKKNRAWLWVSASGACSPRVGQFLHYLYPV